MEAKLSRLSNVSVDICKKAVETGAGILADQVRKNLEKNLERSEYSEGDLLNSFGITPVDIDEKGIINAKVGFDGYDRNGVPNALKARAMESGTSKQQKRPFMRPAVKATKDKVEKAMQDVIDREIQKVMK